MSRNKMLEHLDAFPGSGRKSAAWFRVEGDLDEQVDATVRIRNEVKDRLKNGALKNVGDEKNDRSANR